MSTKVFRPVPARVFPFNNESAKCNWKRRYIFATSHPGVSRNLTSRFQSKPQNRLYSNEPSQAIDSHFTMRALISVPEKSAEVKDVPTPEPSDGEILIKVQYVAQNPTDWKAMRQVPPGRIIGCDFSGTIEDPNGSSWKKGQRVAGFVHGTWPSPMRGAFAEYLVTEADVVYAVPDSISGEEAAAIPLAFGTAVQAMEQRLNLPEPSKPAKSAFPFFINGGTSSVGKYAIQLAKLGGLFVVASGSRKNHELLKELGADECVDYNDSDWPQQVKRLTHDKLEHAFDCICQDGSTGRITDAMSAKGGHIVTLLPTKDEIKNSKVRVESTIVYSVFGRELRYGAFDNCGDVSSSDSSLIHYLADPIVAPTSGQGTVGEVPRHVAGDAVFEEDQSKPDQAHGWGPRRDPERIRGAQCWEG